LIAALVSISGVKFASGVSLATSFADELCKKTNSEIGLIPCADGGTKISQWQKGELLFDHAVYMSSLAMRTSEIRGILWHQGESDCCADENVEEYKEKFINMITELRIALKNEKLPVLIGELSEDLTDELWRTNNRPSRLNKVFYEIEKELPLCKVVSAKGLKLKEDGITCFISTAWKHSGITNVASVLENLGFIEEITMPKYWYESSIKEGFSCPNCGNPCTCSCVLYTKIK